MLLMIHGDCQRCLAISWHEPDAALDSG